MTEFEMKMNDVGITLRDNCDAFVLSLKGEERTIMQVHGSGGDLLYLTNQLVQSLREYFTENLDAEKAEDLLKTVMYTPKQLEEEAIKRIPEWLMKLMAKAHSDEEKPEE